ncbi:MAG: DsrE family protein [Proteobacteria bacterium]|nr:DsrE family protein [Pseudomonadota bacterium]
MRILKITLVSLGLVALFGNAAMADDKDKGRDACPVASPYKTPAGDTVSYEDKFGAGTAELMNCLQERDDVRVVMQVNSFVDGKGRPYGFRNLPKMINDYEIANGMKSDDYEIAVIIHSGGYPFVLDPAAAAAHPEAYKNTFAHMVSGMMARGVKVYFCMNTAAAKNIKTDQLLSGVQYVTAGLTAIADFQEEGYKYVQP